MTGSAMKRSAMTRTLFAAAIWMIAMAGIGPWPALAQVANNTPLAFGMNVDEASAVLGTTLVYVRGRPGDEMFLALPNVKGSALSDRRDGLYLQFRHGKLEGWKGDWGTNRPCCR
ncbi:MAG TPA: hypothetical protein VGH29_13370 [Candidatus Binataceae bacterium]